MKIRCVCIVRNEADILPFTLEAALRWADAIYICDNDSGDGTWELVQDFARRDSRVVPLGRDTGLFREALRGETTNRVVGEARLGDWWCRLDADEIYADDPRAFLGALGRRYQVVNSASIQYYFTEADLEAYEREPLLYTELWRPDRLRYFLVNWSEPRFVRHVPGARWVEAWPEGFEQMRAAPWRIRLRHYQFRSPPQIERRVRTRITNTEDEAFWHEKATQWLPKYGLRKEDLVFPDFRSAGGEIWRTRLVRANSLRQEGRDEVEVDENLLPPIGCRSPLHKAMARLLGRFA